MLSPTTIRYDVRCIQDRSRVLPRNRAGTVIRISNGQGEESLSQPPLHHGSAPISSRVLNNGPRIHINVPVTIIPGSALHALPENTAVSYTHLRAHETKANLVCRLLLEKKKK